MATILVADDRPLNREFLVTLLGYSGHQAVEASDGAEALLLAQSEHPALVLTDMVMPVMDGQELVSRMKMYPALARIPVIFYSALYSVAQAEAVARDMGIFGVLPKPSDPGIILKMIDQALALAPTSPLPVGMPQYARPSGPPKLPAGSASQESIDSRLSAITEMSLELAAKRDPETLLQSFGHMARKLIGAKFASVGLVGEDGRTIKRIFFSGMEASASLPDALPPSGPLENMLKERRPLLLRGLSIWNLGLPFPTQARSSFLGIPVFTPARLHGWLCLVDKLGAEEFTPEDVRLVATLSVQAAVAYEKMEAAK